MIHFTNHKQRFSVPHKVFEQGGKAYNSTLLNLVHQKEIDKIPLNLMFCICKYLNNTTGVGTLSWTNLPFPLINGNKNLLIF